MGGHIYMYTCGIWDLFHLERLKPVMNFPLLKVQFAQDYKGLTLLFYTHQSQALTKYTA